MQDERQINAETLFQGDGRLVRSDFFMICWNLKENLIQKTHYSQKCFHFKCTPIENIYKEPIESRSLF